MNLGDPKKTAAIIVANIGHPGHEEDGGGGDMLHAAAEEVLEAIEKKDPKELAESLQAFFELCDHDEDKEEEPQEDDSARHMG